MTDYRKLQNVLGKKITNIIKRILGVHSYDREGERLIKKSIYLYHKGGIVNRIRAIRLNHYIQHNYCTYISPKVTIGRNLYIAHATYIRVGSTAVIGDNCRLYPGCHLMAALKNDNGRHGTRRHPKIGNNCIIGASSLIIGAIELGDYVVVGAGAIITKNVPSYTICKGVNEFRPMKESEISFYRDHNWSLDVIENQNNDD